MHAIIVRFDVPPKVPVRAPTVNPLDAYVSSVHRRKWEDRGRPEEGKIEVRCALASVKLEHWTYGKSHVMEQSSSLG